MWTSLSYWKAAFNAARGGADREHLPRADAGEAPAGSGDRRIHASVGMAIAKSVLTEVSQSNYAGDLDKDFLACVTGLLLDQSVVSLDGEVSFEPLMLDRLANLRNITEGARQIVRSSTNFQTAISAVLCDRDMKSFLREKTSDELKLRRLNMLLAGQGLPLSNGKRVGETQGARRFSPPSAAPNLSKPKALPATATPSSSSGKAAGPGGLSKMPPLGKSTSKESKHARHAKSSLPKTNPDKLRGTPVTLSVAGRAILEGHLEREFAYKTAGVVHHCDVGALLAGLEAREQSGALRDALNGLFRSDLRFLFPKIVELVRDNDLKLSVENDALVRVFAVRLYVQLNAVRSGERIAEELAARPDLFEMLPRGEQRRIHDLLAKCALRSGRPNDALRIFRAVVSVRPDDGAALMGYIAAIYSTNLQDALSYAKSLLINNYELSDESLIFIGDLLAHNGELDFALTAFLRILQRNKDAADAYLGLANLALVKGSKEQWQEWLQRFMVFHKFSNCAVLANDAPAPFRLRPSGLKRVSSSPKVTVIMTSFNSAQTIETAAESVLDQTIDNIELFIVDDVSTDNSRDLIESLATRDSRVRYIFNKRNVGTYSSKNAAIQQCSGDFVTFHDSDDWMYNQRIERHLETMGPAIACSTSNWVRMDATGRSIVRREGPYVHLNPASTFFRRSVLDSIGRFDHVRTGADSEILTRIRHRLGFSAVVHLPEVLGIGLHHDGSLTQSGATAFDEHRYSPVRLEYTEAWVRWHLATLLSNRDALSFADHTPGRPFEVPDSITP